MQFNYKTAFIFLFILFSGFSSYAQLWDLSPQSELEQKLKSAHSDKQKIFLLSSIAYNYLMSGNKDSLALDFAHRAIRLADRSRKPKLMAYAQLNSGVVFSSSGGVNDKIRLERAKRFIKKALQTATDNNLPFYQADAYINLSRVYNNRFIGDYGKSLKLLTRAQSIINSIKNDSLKVEADIETGLNYMFQGNNVMAYRNISNALFLAEKMDSPYLKSKCHYSLSELYVFLQNNDKALDAIFKALKILKPQSRKYKMLLWFSYMQLWNIYEQKKDYHQAIAAAREGIDTAVAQQLHPVLKNTLRYRIISSYIDQKKYKKAFAIRSKYPLISKTDTLYHQVYGRQYVEANKYKEQHQYDSSEYLFQQVIPEAEKVAPPTELIDVYTDYAFLQMEKKKPERAVTYLKKSLSIAKKKQNIYYLKYVYHNLDSLYASIGEFGNAYPYRILYDKYKDSLKQKGKEKQLAMLQVNSEKRRMERIREKKAVKLRRDRNLQYMAITAVLASVFIFLILFGVFTTSKAVVRALGFFAFIFFFEFIIMLLDHPIHQITDGVPWKVLLIKIAIIAVIFPFHHYIQDKVVDHLIKHKKLNVLKAIRNRRNTKDTNRS